MYILSMYSYHLHYTEYNMWQVLLMEQVSRTQALLPRLAEWHLAWMVWLDFLVEKKTKTFHNFVKYSTIQKFGVS